MANGKTLGEATHMPVRIKVAPFLTSMAIPTIPVCWLFNLHHIGASTAPAYVST